LPLPGEAIVVVAKPVTPIESTLQNRISLSMNLRERCISLPVPLFSILCADINEAFFVEEHRVCKRWLTCAQMFEPPCVIEANEPTLAHVASRLKNRRLSRDLRRKARVRSRAYREAVLFRCEISLCRRGRQA
jgi:hypothetical protein